MKQSKVIHYTLSAALLFSIAGLAGCGTNDNNVSTNSTRNGSNGQIGVNSHGMRGLTTQNSNNNTNNMSKHNLENLKVDQKLSTKISKIKGVDQAHVLVNDDSAYVAVSLKNNNSLKQSSVNMNNSSRHGYVRNNNSSNFGTGQMNQAMNGSGAGSSRGQGLYGGRGTGSYGMLREVQSNNNGGAMNNTGTMSEEEYLPADLKSKITTKVKQASPHIKNVHVSANPEFVSHMRSITTNSNGNGVGNGVGTGNRTGTGNMNSNSAGNTSGGSIGNTIGGIGNTIGNTIGGTVGVLSNGFGELVDRIFPLNEGSTTNLNQPINNKRSNMGTNMTR